MLVEDGWIGWIGSDGGWIMNKIMVIDGLFIVRTEM